jgi:hypothetical protein
VNECKDHKCNSCTKDFPTCDATKIVWGIDRDRSARGADADNVVECDAYQPTVARANTLERELAAMTAERDGWKIACEAFQKVARYNEAELAEARRQIDALATLYADCGDCSICPVEIARCGHDQTRCIAAVKEWSLAEARKGEG